MNFYQYLFNGVSMMAVEEWSYPDTVCSCDACLEGLGGMFVFSTNVFSLDFKL
jgi:hypothetical protein